MARLNIAPTKSNLLLLRRQLAFAEEGYDLLEQKRQILIFELMSRLGRARAAEARAAALLQSAFAELQGARWAIGSETIERAIAGLELPHQIEVSDQHLMGLKLPRLTFKPSQDGPAFGLSSSCARLDCARLRFLELLPLVAELAQLENAVIRLADELRRTQRRCNALSRIFIPAYRQTINFTLAALEERERESFIILKMIRNRLRASRSEAN